ncbi:hypothetical protein EDC04DRAFT_2907166 [Pisolithus marmoratus]|nr:hypothetical protein EDC04DRAFT_2907166 [Pisolithus marmoratus]
MPRSTHCLLANNSNSKWRPYDIRLRSRHRAPQTSGQPGRTLLCCILASFGHHPSEVRIPQQPTASVTTIPGSTPTADPTIIAGVSISTSADHDSDMDVEDVIVHQLVNRIPIPDHPGCQALRDLVTGTIHASLASYRMQITVFNMLLSVVPGGAPGSIGGWVDSSSSELH